MPRLFSGLTLPRSVRADMERLCGGLRRVKWIEPEDLHLTLRFLGDVDDLVADEFVARLARVSFRSFPLRLNGLSAFGGRRPRSIYAVVEESDALNALQHDHEMAAQLSGLSPETRKFTPHVTIGRVKGASAPEVAEYLQYFGAFSTAEFMVSEACVFSARDSTGGGPYVVEERFAAIDAPTAVEAPDDDDAQFDDDY